MFVSTFDIAKTPDGKKLKELSVAPLRIEIVHLGLYAVIAECQFLDLIFVISFDSLSDLLYVTYLY